MGQSSFSTLQRRVFITRVYMNSIWPTDDTARQTQTHQNRLREHTPLLYLWVYLVKLFRHFSTFYIVMFCFILFLMYIMLYNAPLLYVRYFMQHMDKYART